MGNDIGLGVSFKSICFNFLNLRRQLSNWNLYFNGFDVITH